MSGPELISRVRGTPIQLVFCGLDYAGKTAMLIRWKTGKFKSNLRPTSAFTWQTIEMGGGLLKATIYDMGGQEKLRSSWQEMIEKADAVIFVVDANEPARFSEAKKEFHNRVLPVLEERPCCICANKLDLVHQKSPDKNPLELITEVKNLVQTELSILEKNQNGRIVTIVTSMVNGLGLSNVTQFLMSKLARS